MVDEGKLKASPEDWLPPALLTSAIAATHGPEVPEGTKWSLEHDAARSPTLVAVLPDKTRIVGSMPAHVSRVTRVFVEVDDLPAAIEKATALYADKKKEQARALLQDGLRKHPKSPSADAARKLLVANH